MYSITADYAHVDRGNLSSYLRRSLDELEDFARSYGVRIAAENGSFEALAYTKPVSTEANMGRLATKDETVFLAEAYERCGRLTTSATSIPSPATGRSPARR